MKIAIIDTDYSNNIRLFSLLEHVVPAREMFVFDTISAATDYLESGLSLDVVLLAWPTAEEAKQRVRAFIRSLRLRGSCTPIILLSTLSDLSERDVLINEGAFEDGALGVLFKPYSEERTMPILRSVMKLMKNRRRSIEQTSCAGMLRKVLNTGKLRLQNA